MDKTEDGLEAIRHALEVLKAFIGERPTVGLMEIAGRAELALAALQGKEGKATTLDLAYGLAKRLPTSKEANAAVDALLSSHNSGKSKPIGGKEGKDPLPGLYRLRVTFEGTYHAEVIVDDAEILRTDYPAVFLENRLSELFAKALRISRPRPRQWYCASCRDWRPATHAQGDLVCVCGYIVASYREEK